ncbi:hypothetical protein [uncultured Hymenobacter sp.]|uniref:hypothetical protein n=1 Tax=uncultured Hymenobacter sp. TaxID=170016 RepID=UPI0035CBBA21
MAAPRPLPPATRRFVGWLLLLAGVLLALGVLLQIGIAVYLSKENGFDAVGWPRLGTLALGLAAAAVLAYYGRLLRRSGNPS